MPAPHVRLQLLSGYTYIKVHSTCGLLMRMNTDQLIQIGHHDPLPPPKTYDELLEAHRSRKRPGPIYYVSNLVKFTDLPEGKDAYNPSGPFLVDGCRYQWARVESRKEQD